MKCRIADLKNKEVINICSGCRLGFVTDALIHTDSGHVAAIIVPGPCRFFGLFGSEGDYVIPWECIRKFGDDIILVEADRSCLEKPRRNKWF